jgi:ABC-type branched-subunit amino acid transport system substrate-binding protein
VSRPSNRRQSTASLSQRHPTTHYLRRLVLPVVIVLMALVFSCTHQPNTNDSVDRSMIKIGYFGDLTGPTFNFGQSAINGVLMVADEVNQAGGIKGRRIDVVIEDDRGSPATAGRLHQKHSRRTFPLYLRPPPTLPSLKPATISFARVSSIRFKAK